MELRDYLRVAGERWTTIVIVTLLACGAAAALTLRVTPQTSRRPWLFTSTPQSGNDEAYTGVLFAQARIGSTQT